jgi:hypothetical protein
MGQRHQIYLKLPFQFLQKENGDETISFVKSDTVALHHQWLYGTLPVRRLNQFINFYVNGKESNYFIFGPNGNAAGNVEKAFSNLYSLDFENGSFQENSIESNILAKNPLYADNNDGITVIDVSKPGMPKYCFMFLQDTDYTKGMTPLTAKKYIREYYNEKEYERNTDSYNMEKQIESLLESFNSKDVFSLLKKEELELIFPQMLLHNKVITTNNSQ